MMKHIRLLLFLIIIFVATSFTLFSQVTTTYNTAASWTVPANVYSISVRIWGGAGGLGGQDCGAGCGFAAPSNIGYVVAVFNVTPGNVIGIYPGAAGVNGSSNITNAGGGAGGVSPYSTSYNGGRGGNAGPVGSSGGGGGGGAASVMTIAGSIRLVAAGAGGGGGMANLANSGYAGSNTYVANGTSNTGGNGTSSTGDGGGGGGGGGGHYGGGGGALHAAGSETAGNGGRIGANRIVTASSTLTNSNISWTAGTGGRIEISYTVVVPVTWLSFTAQRKQNTTVELKWSTASESGSKDFIVQRSNNGSDWSDLGSVLAAGNTQMERHYSFVDHNAPAYATNYYRLLQRDIDGKFDYSKIVTVRGSNDVSLHLHPNPVVNGWATLSLKKTEDVIVYNSIGVVVLRMRFPSGDNKINLSNFTPGSYFLRAGETRIVFLIK